MVIKHLDKMQSVRITLLRIITKHKVWVATAEMAEGPNKRARSLDEHPRHSTNSTLT